MPRNSQRNALNDVTNANAIASTSRKQKLWRHKHDQTLLVKALRQFLEDERPAVSVTGRAKRSGSKAILNDDWFTSSQRRVLTAEQYTKLLSLCVKMGMDASIANERIDPHKLSEAFTEIGVEQLPRGVIPTTVATYFDTLRRLEEVRNREEAARLAQEALRETFDDKVELFDAALDDLEIGMAELETMPPAEASLLGHELFQDIEEWIGKAETDIPDGSASEHKVRIMRAFDRRLRELLAYFALEQWAMDAAQARRARAPPAALAVQQPSAMMVDDMDDLDSLEDPAERAERRDGPRRRQNVYTFADPPNNAVATKRLRRYFGNMKRHAIRLVDKMSTLARHFAAIGKTKREPALNFFMVSPDAKQFNDSADVWKKDFGMPIAIMRRYNNLEPIAHHAELLKCYDHGVNVYRYKDWLERQDADRGARDPPQNAQIVPRAHTY